MNEEDAWQDHLTKTRLMGVANAEGAASVFRPMLQGIMPKPQTPEEFRRHWRYVFAASAMQGLMTAERPGRIGEVVEESRRLADALLAELEKAR